MALGIDCLNSLGLVHCDIRPENICIQMNQEFTSVEDAKLIDYGQGFSLDELIPNVMFNPEYHAPELLKYIKKADKATSDEAKQQLSAELKQSIKPWSFDVFSLGMTLIEIISSCPLWALNVNRLTQLSGQIVNRVGILSNKPRDF